MTREQLIGAIAALEEIEQLRNIRTFPLDCIMHLRCKYRAQLAALPEPEQPWTDRERRLREALVEAKCYIAMYRDEQLAVHGFMSDSDKAVVEEDLAICDAALADSPPPDPRDEALEVAEKALLKVHTYLYEPEVKEALAAIARAKGGTRE